MPRHFPKQGARGKVFGREGFALIEGFDALSGKGFAARKGGEAQQSPKIS